MRRITSKESADEQSDDFEDLIRSSSVPAAPGPLSGSNDQEEAEVDPQKERVNKIILKVREALEIERPRLALARLEKANKEIEGNTRILSWLGWAYYSVNPDDSSQAEFFLAEARRADPDNHEPYIFMARIRADADDEKALEFYERAVSIAPTNTEVVREARLFKEEMREPSKSRKKKRKKGAKKRDSRIPGTKKKEEPKGVLDADVGTLFKKLFKK